MFMNRLKISLHADTEFPYNFVIFMKDFKKYCFSIKKTLHPNEKQLFFFFFPLSDEIGYFEY